MVIYKMVLSMVGINISKRIRWKQIYLKNSVIYNRISQVAMKSVSIKGIYINMINYIIIFKIKKS